MPNASNFCEIVKANLALDTTYTQSGLLSSLVSGANVQAGAFQPVSNRDNGQKKTQLVRYSSPASVADAISSVLGVDADPTYCGGDAFLYKEQEFEINNVVQMKRTISALDVASFCEGTNEVVLTAIQDMIRAMIKTIDARIITSFNAARGNTSAGNSTAISARAFSDYANLVASPAIMDAIMDEFYKLDTTGRPIIVGGGLLGQYVRAAGLGCCNNFGQRVDSFTGDAAIFTDTNFTASTLGGAAGANDIFVYPAGTVQFLDWNLANGSTVPMGDGVLVSSTLLEIPLGEQENFTVELDINYVACDKVWNITLTKFFGLMNIPTDLYEAGHDLAGVNYMLRFTPTTV
jgi:hypothetical protein